MIILAEGVGIVVVKRGGMLLREVGQRSHLEEIEEVLPSLKGEMSCGGD